MYRNNCYCKLKKEILNEIKNLLNESAAQDSQLITQINTISNNLSGNTENDNKLKLKVDILEKILTNQHEYVDLGLPSGTLWATMNVGASSETDYGNYYQYGKGAAQNAATSGLNDYSGTENPLATTADTAAQVWGGSWHMPTQTQMAELISNTNNEWTTINNVNGYKFTSKSDNSKYIFIPAAGHWIGDMLYSVGDTGGCWSSSPFGGDGAWHLYFSSSDRDVYSRLRKEGYPVRPVIG